MAITVIKMGDRWVARFPWSVEAKDVVKAAGFRFDGQAKVWWTDKPEIAAKFGGDVRETVQAINRERAATQARLEASIAASRSAGSDFVVPLSEACKRAGIDFFPYQKAGIEFCVQRRDTLIADEMGLGKTIQAVGLINCDPSIKNVLLICRADLKLNWRREAQLWLARPFAISFVNGGPVSLPEGQDAQGVMMITNFEMVGKQRERIDAVDWDLLIIDESHYLKNPKAQRTQSVFGDFKKGIAPIAAKRRIFLTGSPVLNRPEELWTLVHSLDRQGLGRNWREFHTRYCAARQESVGWGKYVWNTKGASHMEELQARLRSSIMVRRLKSEVLTELPPKRRQVIPFQATSAEAIAAIKAEQEFPGSKERIAALKAELAALSDDEASEEYRAATERLRSAQQVAFTETSLMRHRVALAKVPQCIEHIVGCLEDSDGKMVVFAHHHDVIDALVEALGGYGVLRADGRDSAAVREDRKLAFQADNMAHRVIVCGIAAMGVGHTLTAASHVVFCEIDWVPENLKQCEDRLHRIGQRDVVFVQHLVLDGSLDATMVQTIVDKQAVIDRITNGAHTAGLAPVEKVAMPVEPPVVPAGAPVAPGEPQLPVRQIAAIHEALRVLAGMCDGAVSRDDVGFNGTDTRYGHDLANQAGLSQRQAAAARRMLLKYHRQIPAGLYAIVKGGE